MKFFLIISLLVCSSAWGFRLTPMSDTLELSQKKKFINFQIENGSTESLPVQLTVKLRKMNEAGEDVLEDTKEISIYPDQIIVPGEQKRSIKVAWLGGDLKDEKAFRIIAEQLPLELNKTKSKTGIKMLLKYVAALYVNPKDTEAKVSCEVVKGEFWCKNSGNKHRILNFKSIDIDKVSISQDELKRINGENILPGVQRKIKLSLPEKVKNSSKAKVEIKLND